MVDTTGQGLCEEMLPLFPKRPSLFSLFDWSLGYSKIFEPALAAEKERSLSTWIGLLRHTAVFELVQVSLCDTLPPVVVSRCHCSMLSVLDFLQHEEIGTALISL